MLLFEGHRLRQHLAQHLCPAPQIEPETLHLEIDDEPWESQIERASVPLPLFEMHRHRHHEIFSFQPFSQALILALWRPARKRV